jgi:hypothetical protein
MPVKLPTVAAPKVNPVMVIPFPERAVLGEIETPETVINKFVDVGFETDTLAPKYNPATPLDTEKKEFGYIKVTVKGDESAPPEEVVNLR